MSNTTDVEIAALDSHKGIAVEIKHDDKLTDEDGVYIQVALLYTSIFGEAELNYWFPMSHGIYAIFNKPSLT
jgi:protein transport protein SEC24